MENTFIGLMCPPRVLSWYSAGNVGAAADLLFFSFVVEGGRRTRSGVHDPTHCDRPMRSISTGGPAKREITIIQRWGDSLPEELHSSQWAFRIGYIQKKNKENEREREKGVNRSTPAHLNREKIRWLWDLFYFPFYYYFFFFSKRSECFPLRLIYDPIVIVEFYLFKFQSCHLTEEEETFLSPWFIWRDKSNAACVTITSLSSVQLCFCF